MTDIATSMAQEQIKELRSDNNRLQAALEMSELARDRALAEIARLQSLADSMGQDNIELVKRVEHLQELVLVKGKEMLALLEIIKRQIGLDCNKS